MTDQSNPHDKPTETTADLNDIDSVKADIEETRAELAATVEQVVDKLDVKKHAAQSIDGAKHAAADKVRDVKAAAPEPLQHTLDAVADRTAPVVTQANAALAPHRKQILIGALGTAVLLLVVRRIRKARA